MDWTSQNTTFYKMKINAAVIIFIIYTLKFQVVINIEQ